MVSRDSTARRQGRYGRLVARISRALGILLGLLLLAVGTGLFTVTQTRLGRNAVASYVERKLASSLHADVEIGPILAGNLLTRAVLERFVIAEIGGQVFVELDSVQLSYDPLALLAGNFTFRRVNVARGRVLFHQAEDGSWNFNRIFGGDGGPSTTRVVLTDFHIGSGHVELRKPWAAGLTGAAYDSTVAAGLRGDALWRVESTANGRYEQVVEAENLRGGFPLLRLAHPRLPVAIHLQGVSAELKAVQLPLDVLRFDGRLVFRDSVDVDIRRAQLPASSLSGKGWIGGSPTQYRFDLDADPMGFSDLQWLPIPVPEEGGGPMKIALFTRGDLDLVEVRDGDVRVRDTRIGGSFTLALEETARFERLSLRLHPLRLALLDRLLEREPLIDGYLSAELTGSGPVDRLLVRGRGTLRDLAGEGEPSGVEVEGQIGIVEAHTMRELQLQFERFEPRWARVVGITGDVAGRLQGALSLDGDTKRGLAFRADLSHSPAEDPTTRLVGTGEVDLEGSPKLDVRLRADPLSLTLLAPYFPNLNPAGTVRGPISARGTLSSLRADADLETARGHLTFDGRFDLEAERQRYDAQVTARGIDLRQWLEGWPETELAVTGRVVGEGTDPASLDAQFDLEILPSLFHEVRLDTSVIRFRIAEGLARVDTFVIRTDVANLRGRGGFGLSKDRSGTLILDVDAPELSRWNRWLISGRSGAAEPEEPEDLFAGFPGNPDGARPGLPAPTALPDSLWGSLNASGSLVGNVDSFSFGGRLTLSEVGYGPYSADSLNARVDVLNPHRLDSLILNVTAWAPEAFDVQADSLSLRLERLGPGSTQLSIFASRDSAFELDALADVGWTDARRSASIDRLRLKVGEHRLALQRPGAIAFGDSGLVTRELVLSGDHGEFLRVRGNIPAVGTADFELELRNLQVGEILRSGQSMPELSGVLSGALSVRGTARAPRMEASLRVEQPKVRDISYPLLEGKARYGDRRVEGELVLRDESRDLLWARGAIRVDLAFAEVEHRFLEDAFDFRVRADSMPVKLVELMASSLEEVRGNVNGSVRVSGAPGDLRLNGEARLIRGEAWVPDLGIRLEKVGGRVTFRGGEARLDSVTLASSGGGRARLSGTVGLARIRDPSLRLGISARRFQVIDRRTMSFLASGEAILSGSYRKPVVTGQVRLFNGEIREEQFLRTRTIIDLTDPDVYALIDTTVLAEQRLLDRVQNPFMRNLQLELELDIGPNLWLRSNVLNVALEGEGLEVQMDRAEETVVAFGTVRLVRGRYVFDRFPPYKQPLRITGGSIAFVGAPGLNPTLEITAEYRTRTEQGPVSILVLIGGTMRQTELTLQSEPPLAESDQLCFLALGSPCVGATDVRQAERFVREGILGTLGSGLSSALVGDVGLDYLTFHSTRPLGDEIETEGFFSRFGGTELEVGKYLGNDLFVTVSQPLGTRYPGWTIEWRFTRNWTIEARAENRFARRFGLSTGSSLEFDQTYGLFIFRQWSF